MSDPAPRSPASRRRIPLFALPAAILIASYQNCSRMTPTEVPAQSSGSSLANAPVASPPPPTPVDPNVVWADEFDSFSMYDPATKTGNWEGTSLDGPAGARGWGKEWMINPTDPTLGASIYHVENGHLRLRTDVTPPGRAASFGNRPWISGALRTRNPSFGYGFFEMNAQLPKGDGMWPAFWLLLAKGGWPPEIDILEALGNDPGGVYTTVHSKLDKNGQTKMTPQWSTGAKAATGLDLQAGYHRYGCDFRADKITFFFDGKQIFQVPTPPDLVGQQVYIILDTAIGGWNGNAVTASTALPADFLIDYVRVYKTNPDAK